MQNGKTLPCYLPFDPNPRSSGYISDRFISGLRPQEFYFHCMAGREGLIDTAVKTSRSGYLQRCLIKQLESLIVNYDMTVRDNDGSVVQFLYGEDGIDVINTKYIDKFDFLEQNFNSLIHSGQDIYKTVNTTKIEKMKKRQVKAADKLRKVDKSLTERQALEKVMDPLISSHHPQKYFGSISESLGYDLEKYVSSQCQSVKLAAAAEKAAESKGGAYRLLKRRYDAIQPETFQNMYYMKYMKSLVHPGENVGTIAAQSVGEPSTQMTLNTFHLAGHGAGNMTLGIPRLKEILMNTPITIKTPIMKLFFRKDISMSHDAMQRFANQFQKIRLNEIVKQAQVQQSVTRLVNAGGFCRSYKIELQFDDHKALSTNLGITQSKLERIFSEQFLPSLLTEVFRQLKKGDDASTVISKVLAKKEETKQDGNASDDGGVSSARRGDNEKVDDEDDVVSDNEREIAEEINQEIDGQVKVAKNVRGYDEDDKSEASDKEMQSEQGSEKMEAGAATGKNKEITGRFKQYIQSITFDKASNTATAQIVFPLDFKKVLMLTVAE